MRKPFLVMVAILCLLFGAKAYGNYDETGLFQGRTPCFVNSAGEPTEEATRFVKICYIIGMPGYPDQVWIFVESPKNRDVEAVFIQKRYSIFGLHLFDTKTRVWQAGQKI